MDFSKLQAQRIAKEQVAADPSADTKPARRQGTSKWQGLKAATFYVQPETQAQRRRVVGLRNLEGDTGDLSDAVDEALHAWLSQAEQRYDVARAKQQ